MLACPTRSASLGHEGAHLPAALPPQPLQRHGHTATKPSSIVPIGNGAALGEAIHAGRERPPKLARTTAGGTAGDVAARMSDTHVTPSCSPLLGQLHPFEDGPHAPAKIMPPQGAASPQGAAGSHESGALAGAATEAATAQATSQQAAESTPSCPAAGEGEGEQRAVQQGGRGGQRGRKRGREEGPVNKGHSNGHGENANTANKAGSADALNVESPAAAAATDPHPSTPTAARVRAKGEERPISGSKGPLGPELTRLLLTSPSGATPTSLGLGAQLPQGTPYGLQSQSQQGLDLSSPVGLCGTVRVPTTFSAPSAFDAGLSGLGGFAADGGRGLGSLAVMGGVGVPGLVSPAMLVSGGGPGGGPQGLLGLLPGQLLGRPLGVEAQGLGPFGSMGGGVFGATAASEAAKQLPQGPASRGRVGASAAPRRVARLTTSGSAEGEEEGEVSLTSTSAAVEEEGVVENESSSEQMSDVGEENSSDDEMSDAGEEEEEEEGGNRRCKAWSLPNFTCTAYMCCSGVHKS